MKFLLDSVLNFLRLFFQLSFLTKKTSSFQYFVLQNILKQLTA